jgi:hypothetical protein
VDAVLGISFFNGLYGRSHDVFGAVPSLHVAYPLLLSIEAWRHRSRGMRAFATVFFASMCFSAVYLDHHWVFDVCLGLVYCAVSYTVVSAVFARRTVAAEPIPQPSSLVV